jgi:hypothetical protein
MLRAQLYQAGRSGGNSIRVMRFNAQWLRFLWRRSPSGSWRCSWSSGSKDFVFHILSAAYLRGRPDPE